MRKLIILMVLCLAFIGCKEKYTQKEVDAMIEQVFAEYRVSEAERMKQAHREGYDEGKDFGIWNERIRLLEKLEIELPQELKDKINEYKK